MNENAIAENESFSSGIEDAVNYTKWITGTFAPFIGDSLLEVGLGAGNYLKHLPPVSLYRGLDYDAALVENLKKRYPARDYEVADLSTDQFLQLAGSSDYHSVLCCNVIEHIEDDASAVRRLLDCVRPGGHLLLFVPAFQALYTDLDRLAGHYRRYTKSNLRAILPHSNVQIRRLEYFNCIGGLGWWMQKFQKIDALEDPGLHKKIMFFDRYILPFSRLANPLSKYIFGQSVLAVLEKSE